MSRRSLVGNLLLTAVVGACFHSTNAFEQYLAEHRWTDAATAFLSDSTLLGNEDALYHAGMLFGTPGLPPYDPPRAHDLLSAFLTRFPTSKFHDEATTRLALVEEVLRGRRDASTRQQDLESKIATLTTQMHELSIRLDSAMVQRDSLRGSVAKLEQERRDKDEQLKALRIELQRLKEIDLKPRTPPPPKGKPPRR